MQSTTTDIYVDIETFSSVDIKKSGLYAYVESPDFEIIIITYAKVLADKTSQLYTLQYSQIYPIDLEHEFFKLLLDDTVIKHAHNATFERKAFEAIGISTPISSWRCSAVKSAYSGLPLSLSEVSKALDLQNKKLKSGTLLIKYFSVPCKPSKSNGFSYRNFPESDIQKWFEYIEYNHYDVLSECEILGKISGVEIPKFEQEIYQLDQEINDRGCLVDMELVDSCLYIDSVINAEMTERAIHLTGLTNPNSVAQLKEWMNQRLDFEVTSLTKESIKELKSYVKDDSIADEVLQLRAMMSKSSVKKYLAIKNCVCSDGRVRGLFQFYGANRTGRWAGRLVQLQNLPQNHLDNLDYIRQLVKNRDIETLKLLHADIPSVLSQLIRTAFIAPENKTLAVVDFSAIEARVLSWLADERWRIEVFKTHGKIYEAAASMMFNVPITDIKKGSDLRTKGKIAELALGYQGGVNALYKMGGDKMGLSEKEMKFIVEKWRKANPSIVSLWDEINECALECVEYKKKVVSKFKNLVFNFENQSMTIQLPSGRKLYYREPRIVDKAINATFKVKCVEYKTVDQQTKKWWYTVTYGGKLVENIVQAISRDILASSMLRLPKNIFDLIMHIHDEIVAEVEKTTAKQSLELMESILGQEIEWAIGLPLKGDGFITDSYRKED